MRILAVTNLYPTENAPHSGVFIEQQIAALQRIGLDVQVIFVERLKKGMKSYLGLSRRIRRAIRTFHPDIVHALYGGVMADIVTRTVPDIRTVVTFHGSDLLGEHLSGRVRRIIAGYGILASWRAARRATGIVT